MATYTELYNLAAGGDPTTNGLRDKVAFAVAVAAEAYLTDVASTTAQRKWAVTAINAPRVEAARVWPLVLAANSAATVAQIQNATDAAIQANVNAIVDALADGATA